MAATDKRTIVASKRARNKRKKAMRTYAKALAASVNSPRPECDSDSGVATACSEDESPVLGPLALPMVSHCPVVTSATTLMIQLSLDSTCNQHDSDEEEEDEDDEELVFVCRPTMQDFCTQFVAPADESCHWKTSDYRPFTVRIPSFRETKEGFVTYMISITTCGMECTQSFQLERRYSEFVAFSTDLDQYLQSSAFQQLREQHVESSTMHHVDNNATPFQWELPPKTWFRMTQVSALEERRSKLETSLLALLAYEPMVICHVPLVRDFLMLDLFGVQVIEEKSQHV